MSKTNLTGFNREELRDFCVSIGEQAYRGNQIFGWIHRRLANSFGEMTDLSKQFRDKIHGVATLESLRIIRVEESTETSSRKFLFEFSDGAKVESVFLPDKGRNTICLSSQVGCKLGCKFCATGKMGLVRDLTVAEILGQLIAIQREVGDRISNVVFMGMGEPFLNYDAVIKSAYIINDDFGFDIGARKITISTVGMAKNIKRFADEGHKFKLAFSLNASNNESRLKIMPINKKYDLEICFKALEYYTRKSRRRVTLEYVLMAGFNDSEADAGRLVKISNRLKCKLNVIPYNPVQGVKFRRPSDDELNRFVSKLLPSRSAITVRRSQGIDINAACGQLSTLNEKVRSKASLHSLVSDG